MATAPIPLRVLKTVAETAKVLSVSKGTIRQWVALRKVESVRFGRSVRIPESELVRLVDEHTIPKREARAA